MKETFHLSFSRLLEQNLKKFCDGRDLDKETCIKIYQVIYETVIEVLEGSSVLISNEAVNYVAQSYYDGVVINQHQELDPNVFDKRAKLDNVNTKDLVVLAVLLSGTEFVLDVKKCLKLRN